MALDTLAAREHQVALLERYGALLTAHQRELLDLHLRSDWSLAEIAARQGTSRAAVHDLVRRSLAALEDAENRLLLLAGEAERRRRREALSGELADLKRRIDRIEERLATIV